MCRIDIDIANVSRCRCECVHRTSIGCARPSLSRTLACATPPRAMLLVPRRGSPRRAAPLLALLAAAAALLLAACRGAAGAPDALADALKEGDAAVSAGAGTHPTLHRVYTTSQNVAAQG